MGKHSPKSPPKSQAERAGNDASTRRPKSPLPWVLTAVVCMVGIAGVAMFVLGRPVPDETAPQLKSAPKAVIETVSEQAAAKPSGWVRGDDGELRYYDPTTHELYVGWLDDEQGRLYIDEGTGQPHVGWLELDGSRYWLDDGTRAGRGVLLTGQWLDQDGERYYLSGDGSAVTGWQEVDGERQFFDATGALRRGLVTDDTGTTYWIDPETGALANHEWIEIDGVNYAFDDDGSLVTLGDVLPPNDAENVQNMSARQRAVVDACGRTPWPGKALCAAWVSSVFQVAGEPAVPGDARDVCQAWCHSDDLAELKPGMIIAVTSHPRTENGRIWGHICIYIGNGLICDSGTYGIRTSSLGSWLAWFGASESPRWGWANGIDLSQG